MSSADARTQMHTFLAHARGVNGPLDPAQMIKLVHGLNQICPYLLNNAEEDARTCLREATRLSRRLIKEKHPQGIECLILSLQNMGEVLKYPPKGAEGIKPTEELAAVWKELADLPGSPVISQSNAANSLNSLALRHHEAGNIEMAVRAGHECLAAWRKVTASLPGEIMAMQIFAIMNQYNRLVDLGREDGLESLAREGVEVAAKLDRLTFGDPQAREQVRQLGDQFQKMFGAVTPVPARDDPQRKGWRFWR